MPNFGKPVAMLLPEGSDPADLATWEMHMSGLIEIECAEDLAAWMRRMNLTLTAAADQLGRKRATISRYIKGESEIPESICRHAAVIEAARRGKPFMKRDRAATHQGAYQAGF